MRVEQLAKILEDAGCGTRGVNLFVHFMPAQITKGIVLLPSLSGDAINWELPGWRNRVKFQILVRDNTIPAGHVRIKAATTALTIRQRTLVPEMAPDIPASLLSHCWPVHDAVVYPRSPANLFEFSVNFEMAFAIQI